ncbi:PREDICTED: uncharacterized protein LOC106813048 [Priapulus caudatus]|uniref:Uncharacterized protein LOC106813048 n=1 Tax=Priapulus caudatus TaxID=37621 RepID=A0ABM1EK59_PRICU|nr:PREDICTED: uncharacterized protein LOC106813048 [Priapulus caudatus]
MVCKPTAHMCAVHKDQKEIISLTHLMRAECDNETTREQKVKERQRQVNILRNKGNHMHNLRVLEANEGEIILSRRPAAPGTVYLDSYGPCKHCYAWCCDMTKHQNYRCIGMIDKTTKVSKRCAELQSDILKGRYSDASQLLKDEVYPRMLNDEVTQIATSDPIIVELGNSWIRKSRKNKLRRANYASTKMRTAARLLKTLRRFDSTHVNMTDFLVPAKFEMVVSATVKTCGGTEDSFSHPCTAIKLGHDIQRMTDIKETKALMDGNKQQQVNAENFNKLMRKNWHEHITSLANAVITERNFNKLVLLPKPDDLKKLSDHIQGEIGKMDVIKDKSDFRRAVELVEARLLTYNKRRPGELEAISLQHYTNRPEEEEDHLEEFRADLTDLEKQLVRSHEVLTVRGKRGRPVPVLIPPDVCHLLKLISDEDVRRMADVQGSPYLFPNYGKRLKKLRSYLPQIYC